MRYAKPRWMLYAIIGACIGIFESARATEIEYMWSQGGFNGGGEVTGSFIVNDSTPTQTGFLGQEALVSFQAHWSGNIYSQPFDWGLADVSLSSGSQFTWDPQDNVLLQMALQMNGPVFYDAFIPLIEDLRPGAVDPAGYDIPQYYGTGPLSSTIGVVPDGGNALLLLGLALPVLFLSRERRFLGENRA